MDRNDKIRVAINGYGVIGKRVADAVAGQDDMSVAGVCDVATDWRPRVALRKGYELFAPTAAEVDAMESVGLRPAGVLDDLRAVSVRSSEPQYSPATPASPQQFRSKADGSLQPITRGWCSRSVRASAQS